MRVSAPEPGFRDDVRRLAIAPELPGGLLGVLAIGMSVGSKFVDLHQTTFLLTAAALLCWLVATIIVQKRESAAQQTAVHSKLDDVVSYLKAARIEDLKGRSLKVVSRLLAASGSMTFHPIFANAYPEYKGDSSVDARHAFVLSRVSRECSPEIESILRASKVYITDITEKDIKYLSGYPHDSADVYRFYLCMKELVKRLDVLL